MIDLRFHAFYPLHMKKTAILLLLFVFIGALYADHEFVSVGLSTGYSSINKDAYVGGVASYHYLGRIDYQLSAGVGGRADYSVFLNPLSDDSCSGIIFGPALEATINPSCYFNGMGGISIYNETDKDGNDEFIGIGLGAEALCTYYIGQAREVGISAGGAAYLLLHDATGNYRGVNLSASLTFAITFRDFLGSFYYQNEVLEFYI